MTTGVDAFGVLVDSHFHGVDGDVIGAPTEEPDSPTLAAAFAQTPLWIDWPDAPVGAVIISPDASPAGYLRVQAFNPKSPGTTWDVDFWDDGTWFGAGKWIDIGHRVRGLAWTRGAESPLDRPRVGTASVTLENIDGQASPWAQGGEFGTNTDGPSWLQPGIIVRFGAHFATGSVDTGTLFVDGPVDVDSDQYTVDGVPLDPDSFAQEWQPYFTGRIESITESTEQETDGQVELSLNEMTADLAIFNGSQQSLVGTGDSLEQRVARLLEDADWQAGHDVDNDAVGDLAAFQPTAMAQGRLSELYLTGDSVDMRVLAGSDGKLHVTAANPSPDEQVRPVFSNAPTGDDLPVVAVTPYSSTDRLVNAAVAARTGGTEQVAMDALSIATYGRFDPGGSRDDLIVDDDDVVLAMLRRIVTNSKDDTLGIESIALDMDQNPVDLPHQMGVYASSGLTDRVPFLLRWLHPSGNEYVASLVVTGMTHRITPLEPGIAMKWTATLATAVRITSTSATWDIDFWNQNNWAYIAD